MNGATDCERIGDGWLAQPGNALSSLALVAAGTWLLLRGRTTGDRFAGLIGAATTAAGIGSFLYHAPMPPGARVLHDVTAIALGVTVAVAVSVRPRSGPWPVLLGSTTVAAAVPIALWPGAGTALIAVAAAAAVAAVVAARLSGRVTLRAAATATAIGAAGVALLLLGRTGAPLCEPDTPLQAHGAWHILLAGAVATVATSRQVSPRRSGR